MESLASGLQVVYQRIPAFVNSLSPYNIDVRIFADGDVNTLQYLPPEMITLPFENLRFLKLKYMSCCCIMVGYAIIVFVVRLNSCIGFLTGFFMLIKSSVQFPLCTPNVLVWMYFARN